MTATPGKRLINRVVEYRIRYSSDITRYLVLRNSTLGARYLGNITTPSLVFRDWGMETPARIGERE